MKKRIFGIIVFITAGVILGKILLDKKQEN